MEVLEVLNRKDGFFFFGSSADIWMSIEAMT